MKNIVEKYRIQPFYPCGLKIPADQVFASERNLGLSLMGALTGMPTESLQLNTAEISIGLGCFGLISLNHAGYDDGCEIEYLDENDGWSLLSCIGYELYGDSRGKAQKVCASFPILTLSICPGKLLKKSRECYYAVQFFGPYRLLRRLKSGNQWLEGPFSHNELDLDNYLEGDMEPRDAILSPPEEEFELYWDAKDPKAKFQILLNMITTFASTLSAKLLYHGHVGLSFWNTPSADALGELDWFRDRKLAPKWKPSKREVEKYLKASKLKKRDLAPEARKLFWPPKKRKEGVAS